MYGRLSYFALLILVVVFTGCSGSSGSATGGSGSNTYRTSFAATTGETIVRVANEALLTRYGYRFQREVATSEDILYETEWKDQAALRDEQAQGYSFARTRITITARPRNRASGVATFSSRFVAETELRSQGGIDWVKMPMTEMREEYIKEIADYFKNELLRTRR